MNGNCIYQANNDVCPLGVNPKQKKGNYVREPKPWVCDCCEQEQSPEEGKTLIKLCPQCFAEFEAWRHERSSGE